MEATGFSPRFEENTIYRLNNELKKAIRSTMAVGSTSLLMMTAVAPIERVKLILQNQDASSQISSVNRYKGMNDCFKRIVREQGFCSLWRGYFINVARYFPSKAWSFACFNFFKKYSNNTLIDNMIVGAAAGCTSTLAFYPLGLVRTRLGVDIGKSNEDRQFKSIFDCFLKITKADGIQGLYRGLGVSLFLSALSKSTYFGFFESGKGCLKRSEDKSYHLFLMYLLATFTTATGYFVFYPLDTIRRRMMMQSGRRDKIYSGSFDCAYKILRKEGFKGYYKGISAQLTKSLGTSVFLVANEIVQKLYI